MRIFFAFLFFLIGLLSSFYSYFILSVLLLFLLYFHFYKKDWKTFLFLLPFTLLGILIAVIYPKGNINQFSGYGIVVYSKKNYYLLLTLKGKFYVSERNNPYMLFSVIKTKANVEELTFSHYESGFDFKSYLKSKGVFHALKVQESKPTFQPPSLFSSIKDYPLKYLDSESRMLVSSLLFSDSISELGNQSITDLNLFSVVSMSGIHFSFFFRLIDNLLTKSQREKMRFFPLVFEFFFLFASGFRSSMKRIFLLEILKHIPIRKKKLCYLERISLCALILLFFEPYSLLGQSFYCSFPFLFYLAFQKNEKKKKGNLSFCFLIFSFSLMSILIQKGGFYILSPFIQLLLLPFSHLLFLASLSLFVFPFMGYPINFLVKGLLLLIDSSKTISVFVITGKPTIHFLCIFYFLFFLIPFLRRYSFKRESRMLSYGLAFSILLLSIPNPLPHYELDIIDVDQGLGILVRNGKTNLLIDTGGLVNEDLANSCLIPYLHKKKISTLDAVILTHKDYDHCGSLDQLEQNFPVQEILWQTDFLSRKDSSYVFDGMRIENLNDYQITADENSQSGVYAFQIKGKRILVMGDAPKEIEARLMKDKKEKIQCDYLVIGHHGSSTSSSVSFLKATKATVAFISCGENNKYGFPHKSVLKNLKEANIPYRRTDEEGTIENRF